MPGPANGRILLDHHLVHVPLQTEPAERGQVAVGATASMVMGAGGADLEPWLSPKAPLLFRPLCGVLISVVFQGLLKRPLSHSQISVQLGRLLPGEQALCFHLSAISMGQTKSWSPLS